MDKKFEGYLGCCPNLADLSKAQLPGQDNLSESYFFKKLHLDSGAIIGLSRGMQGKRRQGAFEKAHVLNNEGIDTNFPELPGKTHCLGEFTVIEDGIESDIHPRSNPVGGGDQFFDIRKAIGSGSPGAELWSTNVNGIGTVIDGGKATGKIFGGCQ
jgi:hypothetical protein